MINQNIFECCKFNIFIHGTVSWMYSIPIRIAWWCGPVLQQYDAQRNYM